MGNGVSRTHDRAVDTLAEPCKVPSMRMPETATLHEKAVQRVAAESLTFTRKARAKGARMVTNVTNVHPDIWRAALAAADGDLKRIRVLSSTEVYVTNS